MVPFIYTAREHRAVASAQEYRANHLAFIARKQARGARFAVHEVATPMKARVDANTWLVDCWCGAGVATDPEWKIGCCYGCGAVFTNVRFPEDLPYITQLLVARPDAPRRGWDIAGMIHPATGRPRPHDQSVVELMAENTLVGADVPDAVIEAVMHAEVLV